MARNYGWTLGAQIGQAITGLAFLALLTRLMGPSAYGYYLVLSSGLLIATIGLSAGPQAAALILVAQDPGRRAELHGQSVVGALALGFVATVLVVLSTVGPWSSAWSSSTWFIIAVTILRLPASVYLAMASAQLVGAGEIRTAALISMAAAGFAGLAPIGAAVTSDPLTGAVAGAAVGSLASAIVALALAARAFGMTVKLRRSGWRGALAIALPMHVGTLAYWIMLRSDAIVVSLVLGPSAAGTYGLALGLSEKAGMLATPVYVVTASRISGSVREAALATTLKVARTELLLGLLLSALAAALGTTIVRVMSGDAYGGAALPLILLVAGAVVLPVWSALGLYLVSHHHAAWRTAAIQVAIATVTVTGYWVVTPLVGIAGPAAMSMVGYLLLVAAGFLEVRRAVTFDVRKIIPGPGDVAELIHLARRARRLARG